MMKKILYCFFSLFSTACIAQEAREIDRKINENRGTFAVRGIKKKKELHSDSAEISIRFFSGFCQLIKSDSPNSITFFLIDNQEYKAGVDGSRLVKIKNGTHSISIISRENSLYYTDFSPVRKLNLNFKRKKFYIIDIYLSLPFLNDH